MASIGSWQRESERSINIGQAPCVPYIHRGNRVHSHKFTVTIPAQHTPFPQLHSAENRTTPDTDRCILYYPSLWSPLLVKICMLRIKNVFFICRDASAAAGKEPAAHPRGVGQQQQRFHHQVGIFVAPNLNFDFGARFSWKMAPNSVQMRQSQCENAAKISKEIR